MRSFLYAALILWGSSAFSQGMPDSTFTMELKNFNSRIYSEQYSTYNIETPNADFKFPSTANQRTAYERRSGRKKIIVLKTGQFKLRTNPSKKDLSDSYILTLKDSKIKSIAAKLSQSKNPVQAVSDFVYNHINNKMIGIALLPAKSVLKNRSGDCTEHSVLAVSLLRSMGIPSRAVVGVYLADNFEGRKDVLVYHMWAEAFYKNRWHLVDATRPADKRLNLYIAFSFHSLMTEAPLEYLGQISNIYGITIYHVRKRPARK